MLRRHARCRENRRFIAISPDGDVYFLRTRKAEVDVIGVGARKVRANARRLTGAKTFP